MHFGVAIAHWTRARDLDKNEMDRMEAFTLHFHVSSCTIKPAVGGIRALRTHKQHGMGFGYCAGHNACHQDELCGYGSLRLGSERSMQRQVLSQDNAVCLHVQHGVFDAQVPKRSPTRVCSRRYKRGPIQGQESVRDFRAISFAIMRCMGITCKKIHIALLFTVAVGTSTHSSCWH